MAGPWEHRCACAEDDADAFFSLLPADQAAAKEACAECPVLAECREQVLRLESGYGLSARHGVQGGLTPQERFDLDEVAPPTAPPPRPKGPRSPAKCGTRPGYQKHRRVPEEACQPCKDANAAANRRLCDTGTTQELTSA